MELQIKINKQQEIVENIKEVEKELLKIVNKYDNIVYSEDDLKYAKEDRAYLNKIATNFNSERLRIEREYLKPFEELIKTPVNNLVKIAKETSTKIDTQIKDFEEQERKQKYEQVKEIIAELNDKEYITFNMLYEERYLLKSINEKQIKESVNLKLSKIEEDLNILKSQNADIFETIKNYYFLNGCDLGRTLIEIKRLEEFAERVKQEESERLEKLAQEKQIKEIKVFSEPKKVEELQEFTLTVFATETQIKELKEFLLLNNIKSL